MAIICSCLWKISPNIYFNSYLLWVLKIEEKFPILLAGPLLPEEVPPLQLSHSWSQKLQKDPAFHLPTLKQVGNTNANCYWITVTLFLSRYHVKQKEIHVQNTFPAQPHSFELVLKYQTSYNLVSESAVCIQLQLEALGTENAKHQSVIITLNSQMWVYISLNYSNFEAICW